MVELVKKRRREIREQKLKAKKNKPMTQSEQRNYMMNYIISQSHGWKIPQLKKLSFEELKILRHRGKGYCHLIRANQMNSVFVNFGAMLHNISRDDLVDLYKIVLQKTTAYGPEEDLERAFAENLRN
ncbi:hypothetical protein Tco_1193322 [Tanacetum coccineum]